MCFSTFLDHRSRVVISRGTLQHGDVWGAGDLLLRDQQGPISTGCHDGEDSIGPWLGACWGMGGDMLGHVAM